MAYEKFNILNSTAVPLNIDNVDTDQIIPARFLKATERKGFGDNLFRDWRYNSDNTLVDSFPLNNKKYEGKILVVAHQESMLCGQFMIMGSELLCLASLLIYLKIIV